MDLEEVAFKEAAALHHGDLRAWAWCQAIGDSIQIVADLPDDQKVSCKSGCVDDLALMPPRRKYWALTPPPIN